MKFKVKSSFFFIPHTIFMCHKDIKNKWLKWMTVMFFYPLNKRTKTYFASDGKIDPFRKNKETN